MAASATAPGLGNCTDQVARPIRYVQLGCAYTGPNHWTQFYAPEGVLNGLLDEVMVYNRALNAAEIHQNHAAVLQGLPDWNHVIAHWSFEETGGTEVSEVTGRSWGFHTGATVGAAGARRKAFQFDGVDDAVIAGNWVGNFGEGDFSLTLWMKPEQSASGGTLFHHYASNIGRKSNVYVYYNHAENKPALYFRDVSGNLIMATTNNPIQPGDWHHIGAVRQGSSIALYVDGVLEGSSAVPVLGDLTDQYGETINFLRIGGSYTGPTHHTQAIAQEEFFRGGIDELKIFARALSAADIQDDMGITPNTPPTANAGADQSIRAGATVVLDGSASFDDNTDSAALGYSWSLSEKPEGSLASLDSPAVAQPSFIADVAGTYVLELVVIDDRGATSQPDTVIISSDNQAPTAVATVDFGLVIVGSTSYFDGSASTDPESDLLTYSWSISAAPAGSAATLMEGNTAFPTLMSDIPGRYEVTLIVSDFLGEGTTVTAEFVATTRDDYAITPIVDAGDLAENLLPGQVTNGGNQNAFGNFLKQAVALINEGDVAGAISKLKQAIERTDGCALRGAPDGNGPGRDWITDCAAQTEVYTFLTSALTTLQN